MISIIAISVLLALVDQASKYLVIEYLTKSIEVIKDFFYLTKVNNIGAAFSILLGRRIILIIVAIVIISILLIYIKKNKISGKLNIISYSLILGGSLGNLIDRLIRGYVVDFLDFRIFGYNYPIFNLADTFIVVGVFLLIITMNRKEVK